MSDWKQPELSVGDAVLFYDNPSNPEEPSMGWVIEKPGVQTISVLVFTQSAGFVEKRSVRHLDDPFWQTSDTATAWHRWGCYRPHPMTELVPVLREMVSDWKIAKARRKDGSGVNK